MSWKKVRLIDYSGHNVFIDKYGYCAIRSINIVAKNRNNPISDFGNYYMYDETSGQYCQIRNKSLNFKQLLDLVLSKEIYTKKATNNVGYYGYRQPEVIRQEDAQKIAYGTVELYFKYDVLSFDKNNPYGSSARHEEMVQVTKESDVDNIQGWYLENSNFDSFKHAVLSDIKVNDEFFLVNSGKVKVTKAYTFPNESGLVCDAVDSNNKVIKIDYKNPYLFYLPYSKIDDEFALLNNSLNELALSPYVVSSSDGVVNVHWQEIKEAARYIVLSYRILNRPGRKRVYHMRDYEVERNEHFIAIPNLIGDGIVFKVKAEDRTGKIIAESRCLSSGFETKEMK